MQKVLEYYSSLEMDQNGGIILCDFPTFYETIPTRIQNCDSWPEMRTQNRTLTVKGEGIML